VKTTRPLSSRTLTLGAGGPETLAFARCRPLQLRVVEVDFTPPFTKTLFIRLETSPRLTALRGTLGLADAATYDPHISLLLYRDLPMEQKARLAQSVALQSQSFLFDAIAVVRCPDPTVTRSDVEAWEVIATRKLGGQEESRE
jgi:hypothetical protein